MILGDEFKTMLKDNFINIYTRENVIGYLDGRIDRDFLTGHIRDFSKHFYVCGPDDFVKDINQLLRDLGAKSEDLVFEQ